MAQFRKDRLHTIAAQVQKFADELQETADAMQDRFDQSSEAYQDSLRGEQAQDKIDAVMNVAVDLESAADKLTRIANL